MKNDPSRQIRIAKIKKLLPKYNEQIPGWTFYICDYGTLKAMRNSDKFIIKIGDTVEMDISKISKKLNTFR